MKTLIMKTFLTSLALMQVVLLIYCFLSCSEEFDFGNVKKAVKTLEFSNLGQTTVAVSGLILNDNGANLITRGICYSTSDVPTISDFKKLDDTAILGNYTCTLDNLSPSTTYFARAYATNSYGTAYGTSIAFTTLAATVPIISSTTAANLITANSANSGGLIINSGASNVTSRGVCYSNTVTSPTITGTKTTDGEGIGLFLSTLTGLTANTTYYIRAYATNGIGTAYGDVKSFITTTASIPNGITTNPLAFISQTTSISGGSIASDGGATITSKGVCWNTSTNPTIANSKTVDGIGLGSFTSSLTGLTANTTYYVRAYATNVVGTAYGDVKSFSTTTATIPNGITTNPPAFISQTTTISGGSIASDGGATITSKGICWSTSTNPTIANSKTVNGTGSSSFISTLNGLSPGTYYYVRAYATNNVGTAYGNLVSFTTISATIPTGVITTNISAINQSSANSGGSFTSVGGIISDGGATITSKGVCWSTSTNPTIANSKTVDGTGLGSFTSSLTGLSPGTTYYIKAYATNSAGTAYGSQLTFITTALIPTITNGTQIWDNTNLNVTTYSDGTIIPQVTDITAWNGLTTGAWCYYNNDSANGVTYGKLYNWYAVAGIWNEASKTDISQRKKLAPTGYHIPSDAEWTTLTNYLGGEAVAGYKMKETGFTHWATQYNTNATIANNSSGFTGLPGGSGRLSDGSFQGINGVGTWWSSSESTTTTTKAWSRGLVFDISGINRHVEFKSIGSSVRCLRD